MIVKGMVSVDVDITLKEALKVVISEFGFADRYGKFDEDLIVLEKDDERNNTHKDGLFRVIDNSYHGSANTSYELITDNPETIENYRNLKGLLKNVNNLKKGR